MPAVVQRWRSSGPAPYLALALPLVAAHQSHSGICWSLSLEKKLGSCCVCELAQRLQQRGSGGSKSGHGARHRSGHERADTSRRYLGASTPPLPPNRCPTHPAPVARQNRLQGRLWDATGGAVVPVAHGALRRLGSRFGLGAPSPAAGAGRAGRGDEGLVARRSPGAVTGLAACVGQRRSRCRRQNTLEGSSN